MKLVLHHLLKDIRAQRWLLLFSLLIVLLRIAVDWLETLPDYHLASTAEFLRSTMVLPLSGAILWIVLLVRLIQSEPVIGEASFWLTRPVPRSVYIPSKLLFIALFLVIPYLIPAPLDMANFGMSSGELRHEFHESLLLSAYWIVLMLWLATYTLSLAQFGLRLVIAVLAITAILAGSIYGQFFYRTASPGHNGELVFTRLGLFIGLLFIGLIISLLIQHMGRKGRAGFGVGIGFMIAATLTAFFFPFIFLGSSALHLIWNTSEFSGKLVQVHYSDDWRQRLEWTQPDKTQNWTAVTSFTPAASANSGYMETTSGPAFHPGEGRVPIIESITSVTFQPAGDQPHSLSNGLTRVTYPVDSQFDVQGAIAAGLPTVHVNVPETKPGSIAIFALDPGEQRKVTGKTGNLLLSLYGHLYTLQRKAEVPLGVSRLARLPGEIIHLAQLPRVPQPFVTNDTVNKPVLAVWSLGYFGTGLNRGDRYYLLVDPQTGSGTFLHPDDSVNIGDGLLGLSAKTSKHVYLSLSGGEPLERMVLYIYDFKPGDYFTSMVADPNFTITK